MTRFFLNEILFETTINIFFTLGRLKINTPLVDAREYATGMNFRI